MVFHNLRNIREDRDLRQKDLAAVLHVSQNTYSQYETGAISLTADVLIRLADYYGVSVDYLLDRTSCPAVNREEKQQKPHSASGAFALRRYAFFFFK